MSDTKTNTTTTTTTKTVEHPAIEKLREQLGAIEMDVLTSYTLADAIREGSTVTTQQTGAWVDDSKACAIGAGYLAAKARGYAL